MLLIDKEGEVYEGSLCLTDSDYQNSILYQDKEDPKMPSPGMQYLYGLSAL